ncbi:MAG: hypothetical protein K6G11_09865 [Lachnospiraceae bacterium]|nr:hypothetical protein [Lachnospiraceae bacterium]
MAMATVINAMQQNMLSMPKQSAPLSLHLQQQQKKTFSFVSYFFIL